MQFTVDVPVPEHVPVVVATLVAVNPAGRVSVTVVPALFEGPAFEMFSV